MEVFRLCTAAFAALDGEGAKLFGGRWNSPGSSVVYTSKSLSLAVLEYLVHVDPDNLPDSLVSLRIHVPDDVSKEVYKQNPVPQEIAASAIGDYWIRRNEALLLIVPSAVVQEDNVLINPRHRQMKRIKVLETRPFQFDSRLLSKS